MTTVKRISATLLAGLFVSTASARHKIVDYRASHPSVPDADLAVELMGTKTGAYEAVISHDTTLLAAGQVEQFDAVYLNNTVGDIFGAPELREGFAAYMHNGGGLVANHGTSAASPDWPEFGATGAAHRAQDEKIFVRVDDPSHPLNAAFAGQMIRSDLQPPAKPSHTTAELEPTLSRIAKFEAGQSRDPLYQLTMLVQDSMASAALTRQIEARLLEFLQSDATVAGKQAVSQQLSLIATDASVPVLSGMLMHSETAEMARYALARIPGPKADDALRKALDTTSGSVRIGIVNSLGERRDSKSAPPAGIVPYILRPGYRRSRHRSPGRDRQPAGVRRIGSGPEQGPRRFAAANPRGVSSMRQALSPGRRSERCPDRLQAGAGGAGAAHGPGCGPDRARRPGRQERAPGAFCRDRSQGPAS